MAASTLTEPLVVLVGPTAVGKTALSIPLARALNAEIVCVDSRQIYRFMDVGTAKPTPNEQREIPHHLLDLLLPDQKSTAAQFLAAARGVLHDLQQRRKRALLVAGSGLYLQALLYGLMSAPAADEPLRHTLQAYANRYGTPALHAQLQRLDPVAARQYHPHDRVRVIRALEVTMLTGEPFSAHQRRHQQQGAVYPYVGIAITRQREELYRRIADRCDAMLAAGWLDEVAALMARGYSHASPAMNSLGYRELLHYLAGWTSWAEAVAAIKRETRRFAKRQLTWFKKSPHLHWFDLSEMDDEAAIDRILGVVATPTLGGETLAPPISCHENL
jgi:tRNA dimethylallyltransferase